MPGKLPAETRELLIFATRSSDEEIFYGFLSLPLDAKKWLTVCVLVNEKGEILSFLLRMYAPEKGKLPTAVSAQRCWPRAGQLAWSSVEYTPSFLEGPLPKGADYTLSTRFTSIPPRWKALSPRAGKFAKPAFDIVIRLADEVNDHFTKEYRVIVERGWKLIRQQETYRYLYPYVNTGTPYQTELNSVDPYPPAIFGSSSPTPNLSRIMRDAPKIEQAVRQLES